MAVSSAGLAGGGDGWEKRGSSQRLASGVDKTVFATSSSGLEWINWSCDFGVCGRVEGNTMYLGPSVPLTVRVQPAVKTGRSSQDSPTQLVQLTAAPTVVSPKILEN